jgi:hypothetical protein
MVLGEQALPVRSELRSTTPERHLAVADQRIDGRGRRPNSHVDDGVNAMTSAICARCGADVGLVLVIGIDDLDLDILGPAVEILRRHARGFDRTHAVGVLEDAGDVVEHADAHDVARYLRVRRARCASEYECRTECKFPHSSLPLGFVVHRAAVRAASGSSRLDFDRQAFEASQGVVVAALHFSGDLDRSDLARQCRHHHLAQARDQLADACECPRHSRQAEVRRVMS